MQVVNTKTVPLGYAICCLKGAIQIGDSALASGDSCRLRNAYIRLKRDRTNCEGALACCDQVSLIDQEYREFYVTELSLIAKAILRKLNAQLEVSLFLIVDKNPEKG